jgi:hypothetical protein
VSHPGEDRKDTFAEKLPHRLRYELDGRRDRETMRFSSNVSRSDNGRLRRRSSSCINASLKSAASMRRRTDDRPETHQRENVLLDIDAWRYLDQTFSGQFRKAVFRHKSTAVAIPRQAESRPPPS